MSTNRPCLATPFCASAHYVDDGLSFARNTSNVVMRMDPEKGLLESVRASHLVAPGY